MKADLKVLIPALISHVNGKGWNITKTKLLKLLYLFDVDYYRQHGRTYTGFDWKFFHLGPWTREFDGILENLKGSGILFGRQYASNDFDSTFLLATQPVALKSAVADLTDELSLTRILDDWAGKPLGEILDYVYFRTEPMEQGIRNERLDFRTIRLEPAEIYKRVPSGTPPGLVAKKKREFQAKLSGFRAVRAEQTLITPPEYDEEFFAAIESLERLRSS